MKTCTFFGHKNCPKEIEPILRETIEKLITKEGVTSFLVGDSGDFDHMVLRVLKELQNYLYDIDFSVILAYFPFNKWNIITDSYSIIPDGIENVPPRFAIEYRNNYMLHQSDYVITYTVANFGGAAKFERKAIRQKKIVINIAQLSKNTNLQL